MIQRWTLKGRWMTPNDGGSWVAFGDYEALRSTTSAVLECLAMSKKDSVVTRWAIEELRKTLDIPTGAASVAGVEQGAAGDPEATLRALWDSQGVSKERQAELIAEVTAKAQPGASVGPFVIGK